MRRILLSPFLQVLHDLRVFTPSFCRRICRIPNGMLASLLDTAPKPRHLKDGHDSPPMGGKPIFTPPFSRLLIMRLAFQVFHSFKGPLRDILFLGMCVRCGLGFSSETPNTNPQTPHTPTHPPKTHKPPPPQLKVRTLSTLSSPPFPIDAEVSRSALPRAARAGFRFPLRGCAHSQLPLSGSYAPRLHWRDTAPQPFFSLPRGPAEPAPLPRSRPVLLLTILLEAGDVLQRPLPRVARPWPFDFILSAWSGAGRSDWVASCSLKRVGSLFP